MANKSLLIAGAVCVLIAIASFAIAGVESADGIGELTSIDYMDYVEGPDSSFTYTFSEQGGEGSDGWYVMMNGSYQDDNENGLTDDCEDRSFTVTTVRGNDVTEASSTLTCIYSDDPYEFSDSQLDPNPYDGRIIFGYVCATVDEDTGYDCSEGERYTISSDTELYIFDSDPYYSVIGNSAMGLASGFGIGLVGTCCCGLGGILLLIGLLTGGTPTPMPGYMPQQGMQQMGQMPQQSMMPVQGQMPQNVQPQQYTVGDGIDSTSVADTPINVWDSNQ